MSITSAITSGHVFKDAFNNSVFSSRCEAVTRLSLAVLHARSVTVASRKLTHL